METKVVSQLDENGYFLCATTADESPLEPGVFLLPGGCVDVPPPVLTSQQRAKFDGTAFVIEDIPVVVPPVPTLAEVQTKRIADLTTDYYMAISQLITYTSIGGVTKTFQADQTALQNALLAWYGTQTVPVGYFWLAADNTKVPFTFADLQKLAAAIGARNFVAFSQLQDRKTAVLAATTAEAVEAVVW